MRVPSYLLREEKSYLQWLRPEEEPYTGVLRVWHIVGFKPYIGSLSGWLSACASQVEDEHFGIFFQIEAMTVEEYAQRTARGERADLYSFPLGLLPGSALHKQEVTMLEPCCDELRSCAAYGDGYGAAPFAMSGKLLFFNLRLLQKEGIALPEAEAVGPADALVKSAGEAEAFTEEKTAIAIGDVRLAGELARRMQTGKGFAFEVRAYTGNTDLVQLLGIDERIQAEKLPYAEALIRAAYAPENQKKLCEIGLFPAIALEECEYAAPGLQSLYERLRQPDIPPAF